VADAVSEPEAPGQRWQDRAKASQPAVAILSTALLATAALAFRGNSCGDDFDFHLLSWMEAARSWQSGVWYPHWIHFANFGAGEPRLVFYPPVSWMLGGLLGWASSWSAAPILFVQLALAACGWTMYRLAREWVPRGAATVAACLYAANPYALFVIYHRSALAELLAGAGIPLIVLFGLKRDSPVAALALAVAAVWLTDAPVAVMASYLLAFLALGMTLLERKAWPAWRAAGGLALGLGLAAFYIVPALYEQRWVEIQRSIAPGMRVADSFLFMRTGDGYHDHALRIASWIVCLEMVVAIAAAITVIAAGQTWRTRSAALRSAAQSNGSRAHAQIVLTSLLPLLLFLQFPASAAVWNHAPWLRFIQFPWRWLLVLGMAACMLIALALDALRKRAAGQGPKHPAWRRATAASFVFGLLVIGTSLLFFLPCDEEDAVSAQVSAFHGDPAAANIEGTDEYTPRGANNSRIQQELPQVRVLAAAEDDEADGSDTANPAWRPQPPGSLTARATVKQDDAEHWVIRVASGAAGYAVLRLMDYPAWRVTRNGKSSAGRPHRDDGLMTIPVVQGVNEIDVRWIDPGYVLAGRAASGMALALLVAGFFGGRRRPRPRQFHRVS
jgi:hypothetical protein